MPNPVGPFYSGIFRHINILDFILYFAILHNFSHIHNEAFSFIRVFFPQEFSCKSGIYFFVLYFINVPFISTLSFFSNAYTNFCNTLLDLSLNLESANSLKVLYAAEYCSMLILS